MISPALLPLLFLFGAGAVGHGCDALRHREPGSFVAAGVALAVFVGLILAQLLS